MMCSKSFKTMFTITTIVSVALAAPKADDKSEMSNEISPGGFVTKNGNSVSASWGGFQASAALADDGSAIASAGGNGLGAGAGYGTGGAGASAGVSAGSVGTGVYGAAATSESGYGNSGAGYVSGGKPGNQQGMSTGSFFDRIFAIPINVLQSVNTYLNQKQQSQGHQGSAQGASSSSGSAAVGGGTYGGADKVPEGPVGADYGHQPAGTAEKGKRGTPMMVHTKTNYDDIFNIPITALKSVQDLLNG